MSKMDTKNFYSEIINKQIQNLRGTLENPIFVILGQTSLVSLDIEPNLFADIETFKLDAGEEIFSNEWIIKAFTELSKTKEYHIISFAQFSYVASVIDPSLFGDRVIILKDNLRQLFPIDRKDFKDKEVVESSELITDTFPQYQAEQFSINGKFYYSLKSLNIEIQKVDLFSDLEPLEYSNIQDFQVIDVSSDFYSIDVFINECFLENNFSKTAVVKLFSKHPLNSSITKLLEQINCVLKKYGGQLYILEENSIETTYQVKEETNELLKKYWSDTATFRNISVYKNPNSGNDIIEISQGLIVEQIINQYEKAKMDQDYRDLFLTAPTGAGKSLLFQLPAFFVSSCGDVTIVVSPLIALMKDQVSAIRNDRNFEKVAYINSELSFIDREKIIEECKSGSIDILYMSPELLLSYDIIHFIGFRKLGLLIVDEAHLITTWGRDFRVDYWFLGNHIRKIRKFYELKFPMVAVTATAIYGGSNDMVFDSIDSLVMHNPYIYIGQVKRNDIEFIVNNYESFTINYDSSKIHQTVEFLKNILPFNLKVLVYAPYTKHIRNILAELEKDVPNVAIGYYGSMDASSKEFAYRQFKSGLKKIMISTKAFGMGVDISDIQLVYHHAPSGLLPDYVQEIGRVARRPDIFGFATLNYSPQDQRYTKALHGMSSIKQFQIREVLKKIIKAYNKNNRNRNLLLSVDDFGHIFENASDLDQKVLTALMMIEKDYLAKFRFNVLIARPKKLFVKVYARVLNNNINELTRKYIDTISIIQNLENGNSIIEIDLDLLWQRYLNNRSFPSIKNIFYSGNLFRDLSIDYAPQLKISFERHTDYEKLYNAFQTLLSQIQNVLTRFNGFFSFEDFQGEIKNLINNDIKSEKLTKFLLSTYAGRHMQPGQAEGDAFIQERKVNFVYEYRVFNTKYLQNFNYLLNRLNILFGNNEPNSVEKYVTNKEINTVNYIRLGYLLELLELGTFEVKGGENPMIFIRINDPSRIERDAFNLNYRNAILTKTLERHVLSNQIFDHFFLRRFTNEERWNFIEDFFLGSDVDILLDKYKGDEAEQIDIVEILNEKNIIPQNDSIDINDQLNIHIFPPNADRIYYLKDLLTITEGDNTKTMRVSNWLVEDPVSLDKLRSSKKIKVSKDVFEILISKLKEFHPKYFNDTLGLNVRISFKGYDSLIKAKVPYTDRPIEFYKWWVKNQDVVNLSLQEKIVLFDKINLSNPNALKKEHKKILDRK